MTAEVDVLLVAPDVHSAAGRSVAALGLWLSTQTQLRVALVVDAADVVDAVGIGGEQQNADLWALASRGTPIQTMPVRRILPRPLRRRGLGRAAQWLTEYDRRRCLSRFATVPVVVASGTASARVVRALPGLRKRQRTVICHLDEDDVEALASSSYLRHPILRAHLLATTEAAAARLRAGYGVRSQRLAVQARFITRPAQPPAADPLARAALAIPADALVIGGVGTRDWWRDPGAFVDIAFQLVQARPHRALHFVWFAQDPPAVAGPPQELWPVLYDAGILAIADRVSVSLPSAASRAGLCDLLVMDGRPGQLPYVAIEACLNQTPVLGFADLVPGGVAPFPDVEGLVAQILAWIDAQPEDAVAPNPVESTAVPLLDLDAHLVDTTGPAMLALLGRAGG